MSDDFITVAKVGDIAEGRGITCTVGNRLVALAPLSYVRAIFRTIFLQLHYSIRGHRRTRRPFLPEETP